MKTFSFARVQNSTIVPFIKEIKASAVRLWENRSNAKLASDEALNSAHAFTASVSDRLVPAFSWGDGPTVFYVPDPAGSPADVSPFVAPLVAAGFSVITFRGTPTLGAKALKVLVESLGPAHAILAKGRGELLVDVAVSRGMKVERRFQVGRGSKEEVSTIVASVSSK